MSNAYSTPGVYIEDISKIVNMPEGALPVASFMGVAATGPVGVPTPINSWNAYLKTFALGQDSAFLTNSYLAYAVYGFFQNGGKKCYVLRTSNGTVTNGAVTAWNATCAVSSENSATEVCGDFATVFAAKTEGTWANTKLKIVVPRENVNTSLDTFTIKVYYNNTLVETFSSVKATANTQGCYADVVNAQSNYVKVTNLTKNAPLSAISGASADPTLDFASGADGLVTTAGNPPVPDAVSVAALKLFDFCDDIKLMTVPGGSQSLQASLATYCTENAYRVAICDGLETDTVSSITTLRNSLDKKSAVLYYSWIKVVNPLSTSGSLISIPACGHICGMYARVSESRGFWKSPAGTESVLRGAVAVAKTLTQDDTDTLNPIGVNAILVKPNIGVVVWGARSCNSDLPYVTDLYMYVTVSKDLHDITEPFVFEPNDSTLWTKAKTACQDYLNSLYQRGALFGENTSQAYYVKCDEELNPIESRNQGILNIEVGYASKKPAEFVILKISHELTTV